ncbi:hypothetical protein I3843_03G058800 [Carya illinoinensis]|uniref:LEAF RUST 10 DISEASE-RESISTANCE LOCUS RECEPTOR-LIKE PROTEIN KINASE-like 2.3 isoform X2 n=1 Tax=Carya illinoinensis TaxID=32201 RepID=UPI001C728964|nr:LEAF RUST 10 DISEASE-RESISTANCE LOCUS RECEPTOR-LIKE PROTEIN KINASE-like 2.3 isoform X2 [Carya illinoinensis]KAG7986026.1 hypothetical protein I3843_03G058800 [Carya illinoinensis]
MDSWLLSSSFFHRISLSLILLVMVFVEIPLSQCHDDFYSTCRKMFSCGNVTNIDFPFWGDIRPSGCGYPGLKLNCERSVATIEIMKVNYSVLYVDPNSQILKISREDYRDGICSPVNYVSSTLDPTLFDFGPGYQNLTLFYGCAPYPNPHIPEEFTCDLVNGDVVHLELGAHGPPKDCNASVFVPMPKASLVQPEIWISLSKLEETIRDGFEVRWKGDTAGYCNHCKESMGVCGYDLNSNTPTCYHDNDHYTEPSRKLNRRLVVVIGIPTGTVVGIVVLSLVIICNVKRGHLSSKSTAWWKRYANNYHFNAHEKIIANFGSMAPKRYTYSDLKKLTKSFKDKVGEGGFGVVYKGKLPDGRIVAVKVLSKSKDNGEEFINEVASISRTSHVNIVSLLGFCCERSRRALIYEFVTNGSLDGFIYDKGTLDIANCHLENKTMFQIAIGIARGLEYLHSGCRTRILHLDIKPHNILLDKNFCPKISDFGLAKMCKTRDQSVVSMMGTRGTIGYIAPEVFSRTFGGVSHKSDVYSYGMLVLEMVGGRKDIEGGISGTSEKYFPHGIYKKLEQDEILGNSEVTRDEEDIVKKMIIVSLWCIQTNPLDRPSIGKVIEMLEGSTPQSLQFPPKPFLNSPPRPPIDSSTTSLSM